MQIKNTFVRSRMNKDIDERLLPEGEYPHAENVRVIDAGEAHMGAMENDLGNQLLTNFNLTNAVTLGGIVDPSNQKIYFFTTSDEKDLVVEYDDLNSVTTVLLEASKPNSLLNFNKNYLITGINKVINEDFRKDLLAWTDDFNPPRVINIERAKTYPVNGFIEDDIAVIKKPPVFAPTLTPTYSVDLAQNNLENKFLSFGYRYKYLDGGYSAISPYTYYYFTPSAFKVDYYVLENAGMVNQFNSVSIEFNTGDERVVEVELVVKASNSNTIYLIESFNKAGKNWLNNSTQNYVFSNSKLYIALPNTELPRAFDNVPRLAKAQDLVGNRLVYGNFLENYNITDFYNQNIIMDFSPTLFSINLDGNDVPRTFSTSGTAGTNDYLSIDLNGLSLVKGAILTLNILLREQTYDDGRFESSFPFALDADYATVADLVASQAFIDFVTITMTNVFEAGYTVNMPPADSVVQNLVGFMIVGEAGGIVTISSPRFDYLINSTPPAVTSYWGFEPAGTLITYNLGLSSNSMKSNRSYEVGIIYKDKEGRSTTVLTSDTNTINIPHANAINQNKIRVNVRHKPPYWADRYTFALKQNKGKYNEIYANVFYEDGVFRWIKLEGTNKDKVSEGDNLVIKSDLEGFVPDLTRIRVLEIKNQERDFLVDNVDNNGVLIKELSGLYMKVKPPVGINMDYRDDSFNTIKGKSRSRGNNFYMYVGAFSTYNTTTMLYEDITIPQGTQISFNLQNTKFGSSGGHEEFIKTFIAGADYANMEDWFDAEVTNTLPFSDLVWVRGFYTPTPFNQNQISSFTLDPLGELWLRVKNEINGNGQHPSYMSGQIDLNRSIGLLIFETEPIDKPEEIYYEASETFMIQNGFHTGNIENQETSATQTAICELDYYNCFSFGNGAESNSYRSAFNTNYVNIDLRPSSTTIEKYKENRRFADLTYSNTYNEGTGINGLNEFNLATANFKEDIEKKYGSIQKIWARDTDLLVMQEDKISRVLYGKAVLNNVDGTGNVGKVLDVLGQQITYAGEYGISLNPESFATNANRVYFTDTKRGVPLRLGGDGLEEINFGMRNYFKSTFRANTFSKKVGAYDPFNDQYNILPDGDSTNQNAKIDCKQSIIRSQYSGTMNVDINYSNLIGSAGFSYSTNGVPISFKLTWNGLEYDTGFVGDSSFDSQLVDLGYPVTSGSGIGSLIFSKSAALPTGATVEIFSPFEGASFTLTGNCVITPKLKVISVVTNDLGEVGLTLDSRFRWSESGYDSPYKHYTTPFSNTGLTTYDLQDEMEGVGAIPIDGSVVSIESFKDFTQTGTMDDLDRLGYLVSDILYTPSQVAILVAAANYLTTNKTVLDNGDVLIKGSFNFNRLGKQYLYLIWDYDTPVVTEDDFVNVEPSSSVSIPIVSNDSGSTFGYSIDVIDPVSYGNLSLNPDGSVLYTNGGGSQTEDSFSYRLIKGKQVSNTSTVYITVTKDCSSYITKEELGTGVTTIEMYMGTTIGQSGISYDPRSNADKFEMYWDGNLVATTTVAVATSGNLLFNKTAEFPTTVTVVITTAAGDVDWGIVGICPLDSVVARNANLAAK